MLHVNKFSAIVGSPARPYLWEVMVPFLVTAQFKAQTAQFPAVGSTDIDLFYNGQTIKYAGASEYEHTWTLNVVESENRDIYAGLYAWRQLVWNQLTAQGGAPIEYKKSITVNALTTNGLPWLSATLYGAYPKNIDAIELDYSANTEAWKWNISFNFDYWVLR